MSLLYYFAILLNIRRRNYALVDEPLPEGGAAPWLISNLCRLCQKRGETEKTGGGAAPMVGVLAVIYRQYDRLN